MIWQASRISSQIMRVSQSLANTVFSPSELNSMFPDLEALLLDHDLKEVFPLSETTAELDFFGDEVSQKHEPGENVVRLYLTKTFLNSLSYHHDCKAYESNQRSDCSYGKILFIFTESMKNKTDQTGNDTYKNYSE